MAVTLLVSGRPEPAGIAIERSATASAAAVGEGELLGSVEVVQAFDLSPAARTAASAAPAVAEVRDDDILEIQVEDGFTLWTSAARYAERVRALDPEAAQDGSIAFSSVPRPSTAERGVKEWVGAGLRILRLKADAITEEMRDPRNWPDLIRKLGRGELERLGSWATAKLLMHVIEKRLTPGPGLYRWAGADAGGPAQLDGATPVDPGQLPSDMPLLVFIHGTGSRTAGSFGAFADPAARMHWQALRTRFGPHIYAFEHRSLSDSPVDNAVDLLEVLPNGAQLYLVTHSRGGLIGDLLCLTELTEDQIARFVAQRKNAGHEDAVAHDLGQLQRLQTLLAARKPRVLGYARVAAPARGTLLASENIDDFLSILANLLSLVPGLGTSLTFQVLKRVTLEVVKRRLEPVLVPGIEAMVPESPLIALLNTSSKSADRLGVIAGDIEGGNWLKRLGVFVTDRFLYEGHDNDLVVNTDSMFYGARRESVWYVFEQGSRVTHFNYFANESTRSAVVGWVLARSDDSLPPGFTLLDRPVSDVVPTLRAIQKRSGAAQPIVFVLPGIMGSKLDRRGNVIWLDYVDLAIGGVGRIRDIEDGEVEPVGLIEDFYGDLCRYLSDTHEVIPFAYDWRRSIRDAAALLGQEVERALKRSDQPVRFVAHSMGGLVVRSFIAQFPALWQRACARAGSRFLMLGTPNRGSHSMVATLLGMEKTVRMLALLDQFHSCQGVVDIVSRFRGALELLPQQNEGEHDWFASSAWRELKRRNGDLGAVPGEDFLGTARTALAALPVNIPNPERVLYVAGSAASTACGLRSDERGRLRMVVTDQGDGKVTYDLGKLPGVAMWYAQAEHGDLASFEPAFPAIRQLLQEGRTTRLPSVPPATARGTRGELPLLDQPVLYPTEEELLAGLMGGRGRRRQHRRDQVRLKVCVVHGDLRHAHHPVMAGHYEGDTIGGAEGYLDRRLGNALTQRYDLGLYPGALGTNLVVLREPNAIQKALDVPRGAIIVGLGNMGELTPSTLANTVRQGVLAYVTQLTDENEDEVRPIGLSVLLIGANSTANITVQSSVSALLRGIGQANQELAKAMHAPASGGRRRLVAEVEIVELYADHAILAQRALRGVAAEVSDELEMHIDCESLLLEGQGGRVRILPAGGSDQWRRWIVTARVPAELSSALPTRLPIALAQRLRDSLREPAQVDGDAWKAVVDVAFGAPLAAARPPLELDYVALSDRARAEKRAQQGQPELIDTLVQLSIRDTQFKVETARTLFELLIPNELKDVFAQQGRLVMVVDQTTANYPWELMAFGSRPACVDIGLVRQLQTAQYRPQIRASTTNTAYVVGDPQTEGNVPPLPAAREEARLVAALLAQRFRVTYNPERPTAMEVLDGLFAQPYRIVHLAGHGLYDPANGRSGMLLDGGLYLTAAEIRQMRQVPDLVFLNCCHLGQVGPESMSGVAFNRLAASISRELIEMGVRAVVAAGWAVRDDAANFFAQSFYQQMLAGMAFGAALLRARLDTWRRFPDCNTSGAYQAYGDPDFRLDSDASADAAGAADGRMALVAPQELVERLAGKPEAKALQRLIDEAPPAWMQRADVLLAAAHACSDAGLFERAVALYRSALSMESSASDVTLEAVEKLGNLEARLGAQLDQPALIEAGIERLERVLALGETGERLSLLGSAYKRKAGFAADNELRGVLEQAADYYRRAAERGAASGDLDPYPVLNWLALDALLGRTAQDCESWLARCQVAARQRFERKRESWDAIAIADGQLLGHVLRGTLAEPGIVQQLVALYVTAADEAQLSARERDSLTSQMVFLQRFAQRLAQDAPPAWTGLLSEIHASLLGAWDEKYPGAEPRPAPPAKPGAARKSAAKKAPRKARKSASAAGKRRRAKGA